MDNFERLLLETRGINLAKVESLCERADAVIVAWQVKQVRQAVQHARDLFRQGEQLAAMEAGQAAWNLALALFNALEAKGEIQTGRRVRKPFANANARRQADAGALQKDWQRQADAKWAQPQHAEKSASEIARLIAAEIGGNSDTIRRAIKKVGTAGRADKSE